MENKDIIRSNLNSYIIFEMYLHVKSPVINLKEIFFKKISKSCWPKRWVVLY